MDDKKVPYFKSWVMYFLLATLGGFAGGFLLGFPVGVVGGIMKVSPATIRIICSILGFLVSIPISFICFKWSVRKYIVPRFDNTPGKKSEITQARP